MSKLCLTVSFALFCFFSVSISSSIGAYAGRRDAKKAPTEGILRTVDTEGNTGGPFPLKETLVNAEVSGFISRVTVTQTFHNPFDETIEAVYMFPLPNRAAVDDMTIQIGEKTIRGKIMEKEKASRVYEEARKAGKVAALLEQQRPNIFRQSVANITPYAEIKVIISYVEVLQYRDGVYDFVYPMTIGERYTPAPRTPDEALTPESESINPPAIFDDGRKISLEVAVDTGVPLEQVSSSSHPIRTQMYSAGKAVVNLQYDDELPNRDFVLKLRTAGNQITDSIITHYSTDGGYFALILQPPLRSYAQDVSPKELIFVLDRSGSMQGFPLTKAKEAIALAINGLNSQDTFNIITFSDETESLFLQPSEATAENIRSAEAFLSKGTGGGGTEMMKAMNQALTIRNSSNRMRVLCLMTDGYVGNDMEVIDAVTNHPDTRVFAFGIGVSSNRFLIDEMTRQGRGAAEYLDLNGDSKAAATRFYERVRNPLLTDISIDWGDIPVTETMPTRIPDLFDSQPVFVTGRFAAPAEGFITLNGKVQGQPYSREIPVSLNADKAENSVLATLWAWQKVTEIMSGDLLGIQRNTPADKTKKEITDLGLKYRLMTQFTSFVAVEEQIVTDGTETRRVEVPVLKPAEPVSYDASYVGGVSTMVDVSSDSATSINMSDAAISTNIQQSRETTVGNKGGSIEPLIVNLSSLQSARKSGAAEMLPLLSTNGQSTASNSFSVDGNPVNLGLSFDDTSVAGLAGSLPESTAFGGTNSFAVFYGISEITVKTNGEADEQRVSGATINTVTMGGNNNFRGSFFEKFGNSVLNANDSFARKYGLERPASNLNQFGGSFGGYLVKDHSWFFGNYEGTRLRQPAFAVTEVPGISMRQNASPALAQLLNLYPQPNGDSTTNGFAKFSATFSNPAANDFFGFRSDSDISDRIRVSGHFNSAKSKAAVRASQDFSINTLRSLTSSASNGNFAISATPTDSAVLNGRISFRRNSLTQQFSTDGFGGAIPLSPLLTGTSDFVRYDFPYLNSAIAHGSEASGQIDQISTEAKLTLISNGHVMTFGGEYRRLGLSLNANAAERTVSFADPQSVSNGIASRVFELQRGNTQQPVLSDFSLFASDRWRITDRFTISYGLRSDSDAAVEGLRKRRTNFAPRLGVAFDVTGSGVSAIRAGLGRYYDYGNSAFSEHFVNSAPFVQGATERDLYFLNSPQNPLRPLYVYNDDLKTPGAWQFFLQYEHELFDGVADISFARASGRNLYLTETSYGSSGGFSPVRSLDNRGSSNFDSLRIGYARIYYGFEIRANYSLSKSEDNFDTDSYRRNLLVSADLENDRSASSFDARQKLGILGSYSIPNIFEGNQFESLGNGWMFFGHATARSALPVNVTFTRIQDLGKELVRPDVVPGLPLYLANGGNRQINPAALRIPADGQGSLKRNALRGYPLFQFDTGLRRQFRLPHDMKLSFSILALNVLNVTNPEDPDGNLGTLGQGGSLISNSFFGRSRASVGSNSFQPFLLNGGPRSFQLSLRFEF